MENKKMNYRLRIAPSPTGYPHIGTIYQALFNYAFAHKHGGSFIVRIEDTDRTRFVEDAETVIFTALDWFGLTENESPRKDGEFAPYRQSERLAIYQKYAQELVEKGFAYFAYYPSEEAGKKKDYSASATQSTAKVESLNIPDSPKSVTEMLQTKDWVLRMKKVIDGASLTVRDEIRGDITFSVEQITDQVLLKSDGYPTYHLAVVVDDHLMQISHILRAEEWISSLPKHVLLYKYFDWPMPPIYHTATLRNPDKSKLSKRHGHTNVTWFQEEGYLKEAILNFLALLGWSHPEEKEIFSLDEFIEKFDLKDIRPIAPIFDLTKLGWMNQQYIQVLSEQDLKKRLYEFDSTIENDYATIIDALLPLVKTRMQTLKEFRLLTSHFVQEFTPTLDYSNNEIAQEMKNKLLGIENWASENILSSIKEVLFAYKIKMPVLYMILTGNPKGLPLPESLVILGKEETLKRLNQYV